MITTVEFETYPMAFKDYETMEENENYDNEMTVFTVPMAWAEAWVKREYNTDLLTFLSEYTWDDTDAMFASAMIEDVVIRERVAERPF